MSSPPPVAVVTGASRGIGRATALAFGRRGCTVALLGRASHTLDESAAAVRDAGARAHAIDCDVSDEDSVAVATREVLDRLGAPSVVVNNAGIIVRGKHVADTSTEDWDRVVAVNLRGAFLVSRAFVPAMVARGAGRLIAVGSISSTIGCPGAASYAASKWGVVGLSKSLAEELRPHGIASIAILPGSTATDMLEGSGFEPKMSADDVAALIVYASLDAPFALTGSALEAFG